MSINRFLPLGFDKHKFISAMEKRRIAGVLLTSPEDVFYTTGYTALPSSGNPILYTLRNRLPSFSFIESAAGVTLLCWGFSAQGVDFGADRIVGFNSFSGAREELKTLLMSVAGHNHRVGITSSCPYFVLQLLEDCDVKRSLIVVDDLMENMRLIKSPAEISCLRRSTEITEAAYRDVFKLLRIGMGRSELAREAKSALIKNGATGISHTTLSFTKANPEVDIDEVLEKNRLVTIDIGGIYHGYCSDTRRYAYTGQLPISIRDRYERMVTIVDTVGEALVPGTSFKELFTFTQEQYSKCGITPLGRFNHIGHNIGLETEERWLDDSPSDHIAPGMVINIELYSTVDSGEQIGNEDTYVISESGPERISCLPREIELVAQR